MRIGIISPHSVIPADSGDRVRTLNLARELGQLGVDVIVLSPNFRDAKNETVTLRATPRVEFRDFTVIGNRYPGMARFVWRVWLAARRPFLPFPIFSSRAYRRALKAEIRRANLDLVDFQHSFTYFPVAVASVCTLHNIESRSSGRNFNALQRRLSRRQEERCLRQAGVSVVLSIEDLARAQNITTSGNIVVVPLGHGSIDKDQPPTKQLQSVGFVGSFDYQPNIEAATWLLQNWPNIRAASSVDRLILVGRLASRLGSGSSSDTGIVVRSDVADVATAISDVDIYVAPLTKGGGVRVKLIEAMAWGKPIISTRVGAEGLGLIHGEHALLVDSLEEMPSAIAYLASRPDLAAELAEKCRQLWSSRYSPDGMARTMLGLYDSLLRKEKD